MLSSWAIWCPLVTADVGYIYTTAKTQRAAQNLRLGLMRASGLGIAVLDLCELL